jgi:hypothetical protein
MRQRLYGGVRGSSCKGTLYSIDSISIINFNWIGYNAKKYRQAIREYLGYRVSNTTDSTNIINYLVDKIIVSNPLDPVLLEQSKAYFLQNKIEIVSTKQLKNY